MGSKGKREVLGSVCPLAPLCVPTWCACVSVRPSPHPSRTSFPANASPPHPGQRRCAAWSAGQLPDLQSVSVLSLAARPWASHLLCHS